MEKNSIKCLVKNETIYNLGANPKIGVYKFNLYIMLENVYVISVSIRNFRPNVKQIHFQLSAKTDIILILLITELWRLNNT